MTDAETVRRAMGERLIAAPLRARMPEFFAAQGRVVSKAMADKFFRALSFSEIAERDNEARGQIARLHSEAKWAEGQQQGEAMASPEMEYAKRNLGQQAAQRAQGIQDVREMPVFTAQFGDLMQVIAMLDERADVLEGVLNRLQSQPAVLGNQAPSPHPPENCPTPDAPLTEKLDYAFKRLSRVTNRLGETIEVLGRLV